MTTSTAASAGSPPAMSMLLVAVGAASRRAARSRSFAEAAPEAEIVSCPGFAEAQAWMARNLGDADVVLLENDLPDLLEQKLRL